MALTDENFSIQGSELLTENGCSYDNNIYLSLTISYPYCQLFVIFHANKNIFWCFFRKQNAQKKVIKTEPPSLVDSHKWKPVSLCPFQYYNFTISFCFLFCFHNFSITFLSLELSSILLQHYGHLSYYFVYGYNECCVFACYWCFCLPYQSIRFNTWP